MTQPPARRPRGPSTPSRAEAAPLPVPQLSLQTLPQEASANSTWGPAPGTGIVQSAGTAGGLAPAEQQTPSPALLTLSVPQGCSSPLGDAVPHPRGERREQLQVADGGGGCAAAAVRWPAALHSDKRTQPPLQTFTMVTATSPLLGFLPGSDLPSSCLLDSHEGVRPLLSVGARAAHWPLGLRPTRFPRLLPHRRIGICILTLRCVRRAGPVPFEFQANYDFLV